MVEKSRISAFFGNEKALHSKTGEKALAEWKLHRVVLGTASVRGGREKLLLGLWEDVWRRIPLILSGHLFSLRQICLKWIKGDGDSQRGRTNSRHPAARSAE